MNPEKLPLEQLNVYGFWSHKPEKYPNDRRWFACFSNWYESPFKLSEKEGGDEITFLNVEQWMMWMKARHYGDNETAALILLEKDPARMKKLGRQVKGYDDRDWGKVRYSIVLRGLEAKFQQNLDLRENLAKSKGKILAEASPYDKVWGIGLSPTDPDTQDQRKWLGLNLLGHGLVEVRDKC